MAAKLKDLGCTPRAALVVLGGILIHLALGTIFTFGNLSPYIISYLRNRTDDTDLRNVDVMWITSVGAVSNCIGMSGGGILDKKFGPRIATGVGAAIFSSSIALTGLTIKKSYVLVVLTYGVTTILGNTMAYGPPVQTAIKWFPKHPSLATGFIVAGFGGGALIFNQVITNYINPENVPPDLTTEDGDKYFIDQDLLDRVPTCFLILGVSYAAMQFIGIALITTPPSNSKDNLSDNLSTKDGVENKSFDNTERFDENHVTTITYHKAKRCSVNVPERPTIQTKPTEYTTKEAIIKMFKMRSFYIIFFSVFFEATGLQFALGLYKAYGQIFIRDDRFLALVGSFSSVFNCLGRPLWGLFIDKFKYKASFCNGYNYANHYQISSKTAKGEQTRTAGLVLVVSTLFTTEYTGKPAFFIWVCAIYLLFSGIPTILPSTLAKLFGTSNMAVNFGFVYIALSCAQVLGGVFALTLKSSVGWRGLFFLAGALNTIPFILTFFFNGKDLNGERI